MTYEKRLGGDLVGGCCGSKTWYVRFTEEDSSYPCRESKLHSSVKMVIIIIIIMFAITIK